MFKIHSNMYNSNDIIKSTSELGLKLFRKYFNYFYFKSLTSSNGVILTENENYINISIDKPENVKNIAITGLTSASNPIISIEKNLINPIHICIYGIIGDNQINVTTVNNMYIGIHTHDSDFNIDETDDKINIIHNSNDLKFTLAINMISVDKINFLSNYI